MYKESQKYIFLGAKTHTLKIQFVRSMKIVWTLEGHDGKLIMFILGSEGNLQDVFLSDLELVVSGS